MTFKHKLVHSALLGWALIIGSGLIIGAGTWFLTHNPSTSLFLGVIASLSMFGLVNTVTTKAGRIGWGDAIDWKNMEVRSRWDPGQGQTSFGHLFPDEILTGSFSSLRGSSAKLAAKRGNTNAFYWMEFGYQISEIYLKLETALPDHIRSLFTELMALDEWRDADQEPPRSFNDWYAMTMLVQPSSQILNSILHSYEDWQASHPEDYPFTEVDKVFWAILTRINLIVTDSLEWT